MINRDFNYRVLSPFFQIFLRNEGREIAGKFGKNIFIIIGIFLLTFISLGFAFGSIKYLKQKKTNSFINWVSVPVDRIKDKSSIKEITKKITSDSIRYSTFGFISIIGNKYFNLNIKNSNNIDSTVAYFRTIEYNDRILDEILKDGKLKSGSSFVSNKDMGLIVTESYLNSIGFSRNTSYLLWTYNCKHNIYLQLPIRAVVEELPGRVDIAVTPYFYYRYELDRTLKPEDKPQSLNLFFPMNYLLKDSLILILDTYFNNNNYNPTLSYDDPQDSHIKGFIIIINFHNFLSYDTLNKIENKLLSSGILNGSGALRYYKLERPTNVKNDGITNYEWINFLSINLTNVEKIRAFSQELKNKYGLEVDMIDIQNKEYFTYVSSLAFLLSISLVVFSIISISGLIYNILKTHFIIIKKNIGTLLAFGIKQVQLLNIYLIIILIIVLISSLISFGLAVLFEKIILSSLFKIPYIKLSLENDSSYFSLNNYYMLFSVFIIILFILIRSFLIISRFIKRTPGDLIYGRITSKLNCTASLKRKIY